MSVSSQRVVLHVGLPKTGTTWLQSLMAEQRDELRAGGVLYPFLRRGAMFRGAVEVRGSHDKFGLSAADVAGSWSALCERARKFPGTTVISHEVLGGAGPNQLARALAPLAGLEVHVVVTARDLGRQATAFWQEEVKLGDTRSFADMEREELRTDTGPGPVRPHFWHAQDWSAALQRWAGGVGAARAHLVVCPAPGAAPGELWRRFAAAAGFDQSLLGTHDHPPRNPSLGAAEIALLRAVNAAVGTRLDPATRLQVVKRGYAEGVLAAQRDSPRPLTPHSLGEVLVPATERWLASVALAGHPVHGKTADLWPVLAPPDGDGPDVSVPEGVDPVAIADRLVSQAHGAVIEPPRSPRPGRPGRRRGAARPG